MRLPELLAPAGTLEALQTAVRAGADAVYIGAKQFNARQRSTNFSHEELLEATRYCHLHDVKLYGTVNILLKEAELEEAMVLVDELYEIGLDGLIVQDLGLFSLIRERYPDFPLHSSTQMVVHGSLGVKLLEELGFERVVLARELTLEEIKTIKGKANAEIKIFCHGALCISYSGQCYMSSLIGGRSGNRGRCAQPCRKSYILYDEKGQMVRKGPLISPKDLNTLDLLEDIVHTGVDSLKIEGRLKNPDYVYTTVQAYRKGLDGLTDSIGQRDNSAVHEIFNRKYTDGYLIHPDPSGKDLLMEQETKADKLLIGTIDKVTGYRYRFQADAEVSKGDGIWISGPKNDFGEILSSLFDKNDKPVDVLEKGAVGFVSLHRTALLGDAIYKTSDGKQRESIESSMREDSSKSRTFYWKVKLEAGALPIMEIALDADVLVLEGETIVQEAKNAPLTKERVLEQLSKLNDTSFRALAIEVEMGPSVFLPVAAINQLRRQTVEALEELVLTKYARPEIKIEPWKTPRSPMPKESGLPMTVAVRIKDLEMLSRALDTTADEIVYGWDDPLNMENIKTACQMVEEKGKTLRLALPCSCPQVLQDGACLEFFSVSCIATSTG